MAFVDVAPEDAIREGVPTVVRATSREIVLVKWRGQIYALRNICPHHTQSFAGGSVRPWLRGTSTPGEVEVDRARCVLVCPQHYWKFDVRNGLCISNGQERIRTYPVALEGGRVLIDVAGRTYQRPADATAEQRRAVSPAQQV